MVVPSTLTLMSPSFVRRFWAALASICLVVTSFVVMPRSVSAQTVGIPFPEYTPSPEPELIIGPPGEQFTFTRTGRNTQRLHHGRSHGSSWVWPTPPFS